MREVSPELEEDGKCGGYEYMLHVIQFVQSQYDGHSFIYKHLDNTPSRSLLRDLFSCACATLFLTSAK